MMPPEQRPAMLKCNENAYLNISSTLRSFNTCGSCDGHVSFRWGIDILSRTYLRTRPIRKRAQRVSSKLLNQLASPHNYQMHQYYLRSMMDYARLDFFMLFDLMAPLWSMVHRCNQSFLEPCTKRPAAIVRRRRLLITNALPYLSLEEDGHIIIKYYDSMIGIFSDNMPFNSKGKG